MKIDHASVLFHNWTSSEGLSEVREAFTSIDELFELCVANKMFPERVLLSGTDEGGREHFLTLLYGATRVAPSEEQVPNDAPPTPKEESAPAKVEQKDSSRELERAVLDAMASSPGVRPPSGEEPSYLEEVRELCHQRAWDATVKLSDFAQSLGSLLDAIHWAGKVFEFRGSLEADPLKRAKLAAALADGKDRVERMRDQLAAFDRQLIALSGRLAK